jgi:hypothetical protein
VTRSSAAETAAATAAETARPAVLTVLRVVATASVVMIVLQGVSAGEILARSRVAVTLHFGGAFAVHLLTGLTALLAYLVARRRRTPRWPTAVAVAVFVVGFAQAALGDTGILAVHVPLAMLLLVGAVLVMGWSFARPRH